MKTENENKKALYTEGNECMLVIPFETAEEAQKAQNERGGILFDLDLLTEQFKDAKREEWGVLGGWNFILTLNTENGETQVSTCDKNSGLRFNEPLVCIDEAYVRGVELSDYLSEQVRADLREEYWTEVREEFDKITKQESLDEDLITEAFNVADGSDGQGGSTSPEAEAGSIKKWILDKLPDESAELIHLNHEKAS